MKKKKWYIFLLTGILIVCLTVQAFAVTQDEIDDLEGAQDELAEQIEEGKQEANDLAVEMDSISDHIDDLNTQIQTTQGIIDDYDAQIIAKNLEIEQAKVELDTAIAEEAAYNDMVAKRIQVMYEVGDTGFLEILLASADISDFFTRVEYLSQILNYDEDMFGELDKMEEDILTRKSGLETEQTKLESLMAEATLQKGELDSLVIQKENEINSIENDREAILAKVKEMEEEEAALDVAIEKKIKELEALKMKFTDGEFMWPLPGRYYISSYFGTRTNPIYGYVETHNGIDIPAPYGTEVHAAASGVVIAAKYSNSYGNMIIISHGDGFATLYAHNSKLLVKEGDTVTQGQVISKVGSTGWSTGNHLHFNIQVNGKWVDPLTYFN